MLTQQQHIKNGGSECPFCGNGDLEGESFDHYGSFVTQRVSCNGCSSRWLDYFTLTSYEVWEDQYHA